MVRNRKVDRSGNSLAAGIIAQGGDRRALRSTSCFRIRDKRSRIDEGQFFCSAAGFQWQYKIRGSCDTIALTRHLLLDGEPAEQRAGLRLPRMVDGVPLCESRASDCVRVGAGPGATLGNYRAA
ncbi:MAG: hypothetical protein IPJ21_02625 [Sterolibacteriaceae bacterium]|jgi:hypothetical protein|nr:hypothetical protein [Sterolibacteriaceae bacterium]MBK9086556.1 hypothetical protein [Sterolibacteriaceae bacterium]